MNRTILKYGAIAILLAGFLFAAGCTGTETERAADGDTVSLNYTLYAKSDGEYELFQEDVSFEFEIGSGEVMPAFEEQVIGMAVGESKSFEIPADQAYVYYPDLVVNLTTDQFEENETPEVGANIPILYGEQFVWGIVIGVSEENITVDLNSPLAGQDLKFDIVILDIVKESQTQDSMIETSPTPTSQENVNRFVTAMTKSSTYERGQDISISGKVGGDATTYVSITIFMMEDTANSKNVTAPVKDDGTYEYTCDSSQFTPGKYGVIVELPTGEGAKLTFWIE